jgi:CheY-like chemotaxis protein
VLIVEDSDDVRDLFGEVLSAAGWDAVAVHDGVEGLMYLRSKPAPALILLDMLMPDMDGWQFRRAQLSDPLLARIPVVVVSCMESVRNSAMGFGAISFLPKPVLPEDLLAAVSNASTTM